MTTGFTAAQRRAIVARDFGLCLRCSTHRISDVHHRRPRGMGGSELVNRLSNGVTLCRTCHDWIESNRIAAKATGWLLSADEDPAEVPLINIWGQAVRLTDEGTWEVSREIS